MVDVGLQTELVVNVTELDVTAAAAARDITALLRTVQGPPMEEK